MGTLKPWQGIAGGMVAGLAGVVATTEVGLANLRGALLGAAEQGHEPTARLRCESPATVPQSQT